MIDLISDNRLIGSSLFFRNTSILSKIIRWSGIFSKSDGGFGHVSKYHHVGTIIWKNDKLQILEAYPPKIVINDLFLRVHEFLLANNSLELCLAVLDDNSYYKTIRNITKFNNTVNMLNNQDYNILGAIDSGLDFPIDFKTDKAMHCSFCDGKLKKETGVIQQMSNINEFTPDDCFNLNCYKEKIILNNKNILK